MATISIVATAATTNSEYLPGRIRIPTSVLEDDILIYAEKCSNPDEANGEPLPNPEPLEVKTPLGWDPINIAGQQPLLTHYFSWFWKRAVSADAGVWMNDMSGGITTGTHSNRRVMLVARVSEAYESVDVASYSPSTSEGDPASVTIPDQSDLSLVIAMYGSMGGTVNPRTANVAPDVEVTVVNNNAIYLDAWNNPSQAIVIDMTDEGTWNALFGASVVFSFEASEEPEYIEDTVYREEIDGTPTGDFYIGYGANRKKLLTE